MLSHVFIEKHQRVNFLVHRLSYNASKGMEWNGESFGIRKTAIQGTPGHHG